ncbi:MAG: 30S ribosomal protein S4 [Candidatus Taylorbacteria bacterium]
MLIGPRYKRARYLGAPVFSKTQTQKYAMRSQATAKKGARRSNKSEYGQQMLEKQKARYSYGVSGTQFTKYVKAALQAEGDNAKNLLNILESRLDNVILRAGFTTSRSAARQMSAHGHITVNGKKVTIPSYHVSVGDVIGIREGSKNKVIFAKLDESFKTIKVPAWMKINTDKREITIDGAPAVDTTELLFNVRSVLEFYTR